MSNAVQCEDLLAMLSDYVDGELDPAVCKELEEHLHGCNPCQVVVDTIRRTITLYRGEEPYEIPLEFKQRLHRALREQWGRKHSATADP